MIRSMTGFGKGTCPFKNGEVNTEVKTLNHKFLELSTRLPNNLDIFENKIRQMVQKDLKRGKIYISVFVEKKEDPRKKISVNKKAVKEYKRVIGELNRSLGYKGEISIDKIISMPDVIRYETETEDITKYWPYINKSLNQAIKKAVVMREKEGQYLFNDLKSRAKLIEKALIRIKKRAPLVVQKYRQKLWKVLKGASGDVREDEERLEREVAVFAKSCDISEEVVRMYSHVESFIQGLNSKQEVGRKLDFIAQELHREVNTVGSKASDFKIQQDVIKIKGEIDKIREQVQNIE